MISTENLHEGTVDGRQAVVRAPTGHVVPKPVPESQSQDPRRYQLNQIKKRYSPIQNNLQDGTTNLLFRLKPSDPDFPFELDYLECELQVPVSYPEKPPILRVKNKDIPRGFAVNIEKGWDKLVNEKQASTLLGLTNDLDKNLEGFLSERKTETVTLLSFKDTRHLDSSVTVLGEKLTPATHASPKPAHAPPRTYVPEESFTDEQATAARARRAQEIRQLESRMSRMPYYQKSADGVMYSLPLEPRRRNELPVELRQISSIQLIIPLLYPLQLLKILFNDVESKDAEVLEELFAERASQQKQMNLTSHLNYLAANIHVMAKQAKAKQKQAEAAISHSSGSTDGTAQRESTSRITNEEGKSHIHVIPRPPEWSFGDDPGDSDNSDDDYFWDSEDESEDGGAAVNVGNESVTGIAQQIERGTAMSFPSIELYGIELLQVSILSLSVKCERCRTLNDITGLKPEAEKASSCKKCATAFTAKFRRELVHQGSTRAGFIDVAGCTVADMLPSTFIPTCSRCSTPSQGLVSVRGEVITNVCRECHAKFTFKIPEIKFLHITHGASPHPTAGPRRRDEKLGLHAGEPLPDRGACAHYRKSYRWFRFSCCGKVHACDKCHDDAEVDHHQEWATRMICGWCSREQNYAPEACAFCGRSVIGKKGRGFWEGGKGTRDRARMSRKEKRKFRRVGGSEAKKKD